MADVARTLAELGRRLDLPDGHDPAAAAVARIRADRRSFVPEGDTNERRARVAVLAAAAVVALVVVVSAPGPRGALARLLGVDGIEITRGAVDPGLGSALDLGEPEPLDDAQARFGGVSLAGLGLPDAAYAGRPAGAVSLVWRASGDLPEIGGTGAGAVLTVFPADGVRIGKVAGERTGITAVTVGGHPGYWLDGAAHEVVYDTGDGRTAVARLAGNTLVWSDGERTYRLESALDRASVLSAVSPG
ncbi:MAG TPA: hypothetical protein VFM27_02220 [Acidimicrobiales bacterium]|nr:hypothetical protein [Acidimicrobiales bacterium]